MSIEITKELYAEVEKANAQVVEITTDGVVKIELLGACGSCSMAPMTLKAGVEEAIKKAIPQIVKVEAINLTEMEF